MEFDIYKYEKGIEVYFPYVLYILSYCKVTTQSLLFWFMTSPEL